MRHNGESKMAKTKKTSADSLGWDKIDNISKAAREAGLPDYIVHQRKKAGWTAAKALSTPVKKIASKKPKAAKKSTPTLKPKQENLPKVTNPLGGTGESAVPGSITPVKNPDPRPVEPPLVTPDKDTNWIWMLAVASLVGIVLAFAHEAGFL
jgi:hypothetical protein